MSLAEAAAPDATATHRAIEAVITRHGSAARAAAERGVRQVAARWSTDDGDAEAFVAFCADHFVADAAGEKWRLKPAVTGLCEFRRHNLLEPMAGPKFDCIFIRNVLIYFDRPSKEVVVRNVVAALRPGGHLVVGPTEGIHDMLGSLVKLSHFLYQKP